jgi:deoxyribose-phosphate aldolase
MRELAKFIDYSLLGKNISYAMVTKHCDEAIQHGFKTVCVHPRWVREARKYLHGTVVSVCTVIDFPFGSSTFEARLYEAKDAVYNGAQELDIVASLTGDIERTKSDIASVVRAIRRTSIYTCIKVILETGMLENSQITTLCHWCGELGVDFVKTSTGFVSRGASVEDIIIMKEALSQYKTKIKASGGIKSLDTALDMIMVGAERIGTSIGPKLMQEAAARGITCL